MPKFRVSYTFAAHEGGFDLYWSSTFDELRGTWYACWHDSNAKVHEDIWWDPQWSFKGWFFYPVSHEVVLSAGEYENLWPGLARNGMPDDDGVWHNLRVAGSKGWRSLAKGGRRMKRSRSQ